MCVNRKLDCVTSSYACREICYVQIKLSAAGAIVLSNIIMARKGLEKCVLYFQKRGKLSFWHEIYKWQMIRYFTFSHPVVSGTENDRKKWVKRVTHTHLRFRPGFSNRRQTAPFPAQLREQELLKWKHTHTHTQTHRHTHTHSPNMHTQV